MRFEKIIGYLLLIVGLGIIVFSIYYAFNVFTGKTLPPEIFKIEKKQESQLPSKGQTPLNQAEIQKEIDNALQEKIGEILPAEFITKLFNVVAFSVFIGILVFAGAQISGLGIDLIKK